MADTTSAGKLPAYEMNHRRRRVLGRIAVVGDDTARSEISSALRRAMLQKNSKIAVSPRDTRRADNLLDCGYFALGWAFS